jgi:predicted Zn-dependent protease
MRGRLTDAMGLYHRMLEKSPENPLGWLGLATVAFRAGDMREAERAAHQLQRTQPGNPDAQRVLDAIAQRGLAPDSSRGAVPGAGRP